VKIFQNTLKMEDIEDMFKNEEDQIDSKRLEL
jgi:hypothetical protein